MDTYTLQRGRVPLLVSLSHDSSVIPDDIAARMSASGRRSLDTDWHVARLYAPMAQELGASVLTSLISRYVVDLNRPADGEPLYPGQRETGVVPSMGFDGEALYAQAQLPDPAEAAYRIETFWRPYHKVLESELARLLSEHGHVVLWDGHSIRSQVPMLFSGHLPDFNLGTAAGTSCSHALQNRLANWLEQPSGFSHVVNGRFKGGHITRHYGNPARGIDAVQLELAQATYMDERNLVYDEDRALRVQEHILPMLKLCLA